MEIEDKRIRIAVGSVLGVGGASLVGPALNSILQPEPWPHWAIILLIIGGIIFIGGLLILIIPPKSWRKLWQSILGFPTWLRETYMWHKYGPDCTLEKPVIDFELYSDEQMRKYTAVAFLTVFISEKTLKYCPVKCDFRDARFQLNQKHGLIPLHAPLELNPLQGRGILLDTEGKTSHRVSFSWFPCNNPAIVFVDPQETYTWEIKDVHVYLDNLHKYRKLSKKGQISNVRKTEPQ
jgi:hypothetical protein